jgi:hypothetical protein
MMTRICLLLLQDTLFGCACPVPARLHVSYTCATLRSASSSSAGSDAAGASGCALALVLAPAGLHAGGMSAASGGAAQQPPTIATLAAVADSEEGGQEVTLLLAGAGEAAAAAGCECFAAAGPHNVVQEAGTAALEPDAIVQHEVRIL